MTGRLLAIGMLALVIASSATACSDDADADTITVMAAASLGEVFGELAPVFEADTGVSVEVVTAGSSTLASQLREGAPADVVALADTATMQRVVDGGRVDDAGIEVFARNHLVLVVPAGNPAGIDGLDDLDDALLATCAPQVPCGALAAQLAAENGVVLRPTTEEPNVTSVRTKVLLGEVDAGLIYVTDVIDGVEVVAVPGAEAVVTDYPIAVVDPREDPDDPARRFIELVTGPRGQGMLAAAGFLPAP